MSDVRGERFSLGVAVLTVGLAAWATGALVAIDAPPLARLLESGDPLGVVVLGAVPAAWASAFAAVALRRSRRPARGVAVSMAAACAALSLVAGYGALGLYLVAVLATTDPSAAVVGGLATLPIGPLLAATTWLAAAAAPRPAFVAVRTAADGPDTAWVDAPRPRDLLLAAVDAPAADLAPLRFQAVDARPALQAAGVDAPRAARKSAADLFDELD